jgi:tetratricopeptide (TPR) repeat protein
MLERLASEEADAAQAAAIQYDRGELAMLQFDTVSARIHYDKAERYQPDNPRYTEPYGLAAYEDHDYVVAENEWRRALQRYRELAAGDPGYRPDLARTLSNLGGLYSDTGRQDEAEKAFDEALTILRSLAEHDRGPTSPRWPRRSTLSATFTLTRAAKAMR